MANTVINPTLYARSTQMYLRSGLVVEEITRSQFVADLMPGQTINFPYATDVRLQNYSYSTDAVIDPTSWTSNTYSIDQVKICTANFDPLQNLVASDMEPETLVSDQMGYQLSRNIDQYGLMTGINGAANTVVGGTLSASNMFETLTTTNAVLSQAQARAGTRFVVLDPLRVAVLANTDKANGFNVADAALKNGFVGETSAGFKVLQSNNLPYTVTLTIAVNPTAGDTFTILGNTWTYVANGTATNPGEISLGTGGSALTDTQANVKAAINGTGTPGATTYIDFAVNTRRLMSTSQLTASTFSANVSTITNFGNMTPSAVFTSGSNSFGTQTVSFLAGVVGAIDLTVQAEPEIEVRKPPANKSYNILGTTQFGAGVFFNDKPSLVKITANA